MSKTILKEIKQILKYKPEKTKEEIIYLPSIKEKKREKIKASVREEDVISYQQAID